VGEKSKDKSGLYMKTQNRKTRKKRALALKLFFGMGKPPNARQETIEKLCKEAAYQCMYEKYANW
jgi:hypothetical protein